MKNLIKELIFIAFISITLTSCEKDNYEIAKIESEQTSKKLDISATKVGDNGHNDCTGDCTNNEASERSIPTINLTDAHAAKAGVLTSTLKGPDYISDYYTLSQHAIDNNYVVTNFNLHYDALNAGVEACSVIVNGNDSEEVFTNERYNNLMALIIFYEGESNPTNIDQIISSLKTDLNTNKNKSKSEVLTFLDE